MRSSTSWRCMKTPRLGSPQATPRHPANPPSSICIPIQDWHMPSEISTTFIPRAPRFSETEGQKTQARSLDEPLLSDALLGLARQHTKWCWEVRHAAEVPAAMARAFKIAQTPPTGPVFLSLPVNVMEERAD